VLSLLVLMLAVVGVFADIPFVSNYAFWVAVAAYVILYWGGAMITGGSGATNWPGILSLLLLGLAVVGVFIDIPFVSNYAFWVAVAAYIIRDWTFNRLLFVGMLSLLVMGLAVVGVFIQIPFVSNYAFWLAVAAYVIRLLVQIPHRAPIRIGLINAD
jgi:hypothetical protein